MVFGWKKRRKEKKVAFKNKPVLKKDIEKVVKCFIISMYTIILSQYC